MAEVSGDSATVQANFTETCRVGLQPPVHRVLAPRARRRAVAARRAALLGRGEPLSLHGDRQLVGRDAIPAGALGEVEGRVSAAQQRLGIATVDRIPQRHAAGDAERRQVVHRPRVATRTRSATAMAPFRSTSGQQEQELLAAVAEGHVGAAGRTSQDLPDSTERGIAGQVTVLVVVRLEMVEVEEDERKRQRTQPVALVEQPGDRLVERQPIPDSGQRVATGDDG